MNGNGARRFLTAAVVGLVLLSAQLSHSFSLLGPYASWMTPTLGYGNSIGGPMALGEEYRMAVPVVTYGFDQSFLDYFGQPGVDAVEQAVQVLNDLPPASALVLSNYDLYTTEGDHATGRLIDMKSMTMSVLLGHMGLASPTANTWALKSWIPAPGPPFQCIFEGRLPQEYSTPDYILWRNYDPYTHQPSRNVNDIAYSFYSEGFSDCSKIRIWSTPIDFAVPYNFAVADGMFNAYGQLYTGLTRDDAGGIAYLLSATNINVETLDSTISLAPGNGSKLARTAPRPGIEKIRFVPHPTSGLGHFLASTNLFADYYFTNGTQATQYVQRVNSEPDVLFSAKLVIPELHYPQVYLPSSVEQSGTSNWVNNASLNGNPGGSGPGTIQGPIHIVFNSPAQHLSAAGGRTNKAVICWDWGTVNATNPMFFPSNQTNLTSLSLGAQIITTNTPAIFESTVLGHQDRSYSIECSTNLLDWTSVAVIANTNGMFRFSHPLDQPGQYFRAVLQ